MEIHKQLGGWLRSSHTFKECYPNIKDEEIPCAGCGEWVLIDVPGVSLDEIFPIHKADEVLMFGKYKGKSFGEVFGMGDVYFLAALGPYFSPSQILFVGLFSFVIGGGVVIGWMILSKRNQLYAKIPFAPFISISALLTYLFSIQWF